LAPRRAGMGCGAARAVLLFVASGLSRVGTCCGGRDGLAVTGRAACQGPLRLGTRRGWQGLGGSQLSNLAALRVHLLPSERRAIDKVPTDSTRWSNAIALIRDMALRSERGVSNDLFGWGSATSPVVRSGTTQMDDSKSHSNRVVDLDGLLARLETRISKLMIRALTQPGYDDEIAGLVLVRDDLRDRQRRTGEHPAQPRRD
jgi:hypothetical protein